ncbi:MAG: ABC transporter permease subunit [Gammaproteobacteria bacterium]
MLSQIIQKLHQFLPGLLSTLGIFLSVLGTSFIFACILSYWSNRGVVWINFLIEKFVFFIRGTPLLVQIFIVYYGLGQFECLQESFLWPILKEPMYCAWLGLSMNATAYATALFSGNIRNIDLGQIEASLALGMDRPQILLHILLPQAIKNSLGSYSNEIILILKSTSLASSISILELTGLTRQFISETYNAIEWFFLAGILYVILNLFFMSVFKLTTRNLKVVM